MVSFCDPKEEESVRNKSPKSTYLSDRIVCAIFAGKNTTFASPRTRDEDVPDAEGGFWGAFPANKH